MWCLVIFKQCLKGFVSKPELESAPAWLAPTGLLPHTLGVTGQRANQSSCVMVDILLDSLFHSKHHWYTNQTINSSAKVICQSRVWVHVKFSNTKLAAIFFTWVLLNISRHVMGPNRDARGGFWQARPGNNVQSRLWTSNKIWVRAYKTETQPSKSDLKFLAYQSKINLFDCICYHYMLFLQAINNILFDEKKLTALLIRISDARVASLDVRRIHPVESVCQVYLIKQCSLDSMTASAITGQRKTTWVFCFRTNY